MTKPQGVESLEQIPLEADAAIDTDRHLQFPRQWAEFLAKDPPWKEQNVTGASEHHYCPPPNEHIPNGWKVSQPPIKVFCPSEECGTETWFDCRDNSRLFEDINHMSLILTYQCRHCQRTTKQYAVNLLIEKLQRTAAPVIKATKFGEWPPYGQNPPRRLRKLLGEEDFDFLSKGLRTESQGLGIAAFAYYRRVVENKKNALLDAIISVARQTGSSSELIGELVAAKTETQFEKAVTSIKSGIPVALLIDNYNPLQLLHTALSVGIHAESDAECLSMARTIRLVLYEFSERLNAVLADHSELSNAIKELTKARDAKRQRANPLT